MSDVVQDAVVTRCVMFDFDGTLADSFAAIAESYRIAFRTVLGLEYPSTDEDLVTLRSLRLVEHCALIGGDRAGACVDAFRDAYSGVPPHPVRLFAGVDALLDGLEARGVRMAIVTNKTLPGLTADLDRTGLDVARFDAVVTAEQSPIGKPDPGPLLLGLAALGCAPGDAIYVGDGPHDVVAATAAGVRAVGVAYGDWGAPALRAAGAEVVVADPRDLLAAVDRWPAAAAAAAIDPA